MRGSQSARRAAARRARYAFLERARTACDAAVVAVAHTADDLSHRDMINNNIAMFLIHELRVAQRCTVSCHCRGIITHMKAKVQGFIRAKAYAFASISEKVRQSLTS